MELPELRTLAERLIWARRRLGWTQEELGERCPGSSRAQIQKIEIGKTLRPRNMDELAKTLDVPRAWLQFGQAEIESLSRETIKAALKLQSLPPEQQRMILAAIDAALNK